MQFERTVRNPVLRNAANSKVRSETTYSHATTNLKATDVPLPLYDTAPSDEIALLDFEEIAAERLKALRKIEELKLRHGNKWEELSKEFRKDVVPHFPLASGTAADNKVESLYRRDLVGHFALRLAFCRSPEDTKWFVTHEIDLFRLRFQNLKSSAVTAFFHNYDLDAEMMSEEEREAMVEELSAACRISPTRVRATDFWKIDACSALELVRKRKVFLRGGIAFLPYTELQTIVVQRLRTLINAAMARANRFIGVLEEQNRLLPRLERLTKGAGGGSDFKPTDGQAVTRQQIDALSKSTFPLCMSSIHNHMRKTHHLKHGGRRQYGLFLKAIGLSLEEALAFFREEFTKKMDSDKFDKQYAYNVRHSYGKEGCRKDYKAFSCATIILGNPPGPEDCHGCPFRHAKEEDLRSRLKSDGIDKENEDNIVALSKMSQFDKACTMHCELTHGLPLGGLQTLITHPNQYYELARERLTGGRAVKTEVKEEKEEPMEE